MVKYVNIDSKTFVKKIKSKQIVMSDRNEGIESCKCIIF